MNILPHKSWHVRTKQNIARVRRDEEKARKEEEEKLRRINLAEHESRIALLRSKSGQNVADSNTVQTTKESFSSPPSTSFNLFDNYKDKISNDSGKETEKKNEQEKWEVKAGIFSYLDGRHKYENSVEEEWYLKSHDERFKLKEDSKITSKTLKDTQVKVSNDPLVDMKRYLALMKKHELSASKEDTNRTTKRKVEAIKKEEVSEYTPSKSKSKKKSKKKNKKRKHQTDSESETSSATDSELPNSSKQLVIQKLREERLRREKKERERTRLLLHGPSQPSKPNGNIASFKQKYNSQFNPHIAKQNNVNS